MQIQAYIGAAETQRLIASVQQLMTFSISKPKLIGVSQKVKWVNSAYLRRIGIPMEGLSTQQN